MAGQDRGKASSGARTNLGGRISVACPSSWPRKVAEAAERAEMTPAEWVRDAIRKALAAEQKRRYRERAR